MKNTPKSVSIPKKILKFAARTVAITASLGAMLLGFKVMAVKTYLPSVNKQEQLVDNEKKLLQGIFGDKLDANAVRKNITDDFIDGFFQTTMATEPWAIRNIYICGPDQYEADYTKGNPQNRHTFIHEATHLVDHKKVGPLVSRIAHSLYRDFTKGRVRSTDVYDYKLAPHFNLESYTLEQRATIAADYTERFIAPFLHDDDHTFVITAKTQADSLLMNVVENEFTAARNTRKAIEAARLKI